MGTVANKKFIKSTTMPKSKAKKEPKVKVPDGDPAKGLGVFNTHCAACHSMEKGDDKTSAAPNLSELLGATAGNRSTFPYSNAMKKSGIVWSEKHLFVYLKAPAKYVAGTRMAFAGITDEQERADLIAYLKDPYF